MLLSNILVFFKRKLVFTSLHKCINSLYMHIDLAYICSIPSIVMRVLYFLSNKANQFEVGWVMAQT